MEKQLTSVIISGKSEEELKKFKDDSIDSVVTDPPYELNFMGKAWDSSGIAFSVDLWKEVYRVLKPGAHLLAFGGTRTYHRMVVAIEDAGFEIRDQLQWIYGSGFPKSLNVGKSIIETEENFEWDGWGTGLKPAHEPICLARKPISEGSIAKNVIQHRTGAINIDDCRIDLNGEKQPSGSAKVWLRGNSYTDIKKYGEDKVTPPSGRFPSNVIMDDEAGRILDTQAPAAGAFAPVKSNQKNPKTKSIYGKFAGNGDDGRSFHDGVRSGASRFFYCPKVSRWERDFGLNHHHYNPANYGKNMSSSGKGTISQSKSPMKNNHPTVKPIALLDYLMRLITPPGGLVLDPFSGSGSGGCAAVKGKFGYIGIDSDPQNFDLSRARIKAFREYFEKAEKVLPQTLPFSSDPLTE